MVLALIVLLASLPVASSLFSECSKKLIDSTNYRLSCHSACLNQKVFDQILTYIDKNVTVFEIGPGKDCSHTFSLPHRDYFSFLEKLTIQGGRFEELNETLFRIFPSLVFLDFSQNELEAMKFQQKKNYSELQTLIVDNNFLTLENIDLSPFENLEILSLKRNNITGLTRKIFSNTPNLKELVLNENPITEIPEDVFSDTPDLETLEMKNCDFSVIPDTTFSNLQQLEILDLSGNKLSSKIFNSIVILSQKLTLLSLANNAITELHKNCFQNWQIDKLDLTYLRLLHDLPKDCFRNANVSELIFANSHLDFGNFAALNDLSRTLVALDLSGNHIVTIRENVIENLPNLRKLHLRKTGLLQLPNPIPPWIANLELLDVGENQLTHFARTYLQQLPALKDFRIDGNQIRKIDTATLRYIETLNIVLLHSNPYKCRCEAQELRSFLLFRNLTRAKNFERSTLAEITCATPPHMAGKSIIRLTDKQAPKCSRIFRVHGLSNEVEVLILAAAGVTVCVFIAVAIGLTQNKTCLEHMEPDGGREVEHTTEEVFPLNVPTVIENEDFDDGKVTEL